MLGKILGAVWYLVVCGVFLAAGTFAGWAHRNPFFWKVVTQMPNPPKPSEVFGSNVQTLLILGCDEDMSRNAAIYENPYVTRHAARSDMMMVCRLDFAKKEISGVSIPRDTWCRLPGFREHKINAYHAIAKFGEADQLTKRAVEYLIGVPIDKVVTIDYAAFQRLVDMVGGVTVHVSKPMEYDDKAGGLHVHLAPGTHTLNGYDAMCYVRYRKPNKGSKIKADTDFQRQDRQRDFLIGFKQSIFASKFRLPEISQASKDVLGNVLTDEQIISLAFFSREVPPGNIRIGTIPTTEEGNGLRLDSEKLPKVLAEFKLVDNGTRVSLR